MEKWLRTLSERDRVFVLYGGLLAGVLLFYFMIWSPLSEKNADLIVSNAQTRDLITWIQKAKPQLMQIHQQAKNKSAMNISLLSAIEQSVKRNHLDAAAGEIKQLENNRVQVSFAKVGYLPVMRWIEDIQVTSASKIDKVSIQKTEKPGIVHLEVTLER